MKTKKEKLLINLIIVPFSFVLGIISIPILALSIGQMTLYNFMDSCFGVVWVCQNIYGQGIGSEDVTVGFSKVVTIVILTMIYYLLLRKLLYKLQ